MDLNNKIHPTAVLDGEVTLGTNICIGAFTYIKGPVTIQDDVQIGVRCIIGTPAEHNKKPSNGSVFIGKGTQLTDGVIVHKGTDDIQTTIGCNCYIMNQSYIAHDCILGNNVVLSAQVSLAGNVKLQEGCNLGMGVQVHQFVTIGAYAMVGMASPVTKDIPPFVKAYGNPVRLRSLNTYPMQKLGINPNNISLVNNMPQCNVENEIFNAFKKSFLSIASRSITKASL